ncbi:hypothetical protein JW868_03590 [Candidatus Woesearchaeota archaeon]|nr:hypothetical protein [Candidatus Woesearchaeota archaeon]
MIVPLFASSVSAMDVHAVNSKDWKDVYSVMLASKFDKNIGMFVNSESIASITRITPSNLNIVIYENEDNPMIRNMESQLESAGYTVTDTIRSDKFNLDLDPETGKYFVIDEGNFRISVSLAPYAVNNGYWVLIVNEDNVDDVINKISTADEVIAVGNIGRNILNQIEQYITRTINNNNVFRDSQDIAKMFPDMTNIILADGSLIENEFFNAGNPVLLTGPNKILDEMYEFIRANNVRSVTIVGNQLSVVGEIIRERSNKEISAFVKFGQSDVDNTGKVYALSMFPMPQIQLAFTIIKVEYNPLAKEIITYYNNLGNSELYQLTTLSVKNGDEEIGAASDEEVVFVGAGELLPVTYPIDIPIDQIMDETIVEFFTSFGVSPTQLDAFLTSEGKYGPPFNLPLQVKEIQADTASIELVDAAYYKRLKRIGVSVQNNVDETGKGERVYYSVKLNGVIVNGLEEDFFRQDDLGSGMAKTTYIPVELDEMDMQENKEFQITIVYGTDEDFMVNQLRKTLPFRVEHGNFLTGLVTGLTGTGSIIGLIVVVVLAVVAIFVFRIRKNKKPEQPATILPPI